MRTRSDPEAQSRSHKPEKAGADVAAKPAGSEAGATQDSEPEGRKAGPSPSESPQPASAPPSAQAPRLRSPRLPLPRLTVQVILGIMAGIAFLYFARDVAVPIVLATVVGMALHPPVRWLRRWHVPRPLGAAVVLGLVAVGLSLGFMHLSRPAVAWMSEGPEHLEEVRERLRGLLRPAAQISETAEAVAKLGATEEPQEAVPVEVKEKGLTTTLFNWTSSLVMRLVETVVLVYLLLATGDHFMPKFIRLIPTLRDKRSAVEISRDIQQRISTYLFSISLINLGFGAIVGAGFYFIGLPNPALWGAVAAILNFIPYFGPLLGTLMIWMVGILSFNSLAAALVPPAWYLLLHTVESNVATPFILGRRLTMSPVVIFVALIFWMWLWGITGALLSVPILVSLKVMCERIDALAPFSELLGK